jgi:hypothetical protein
VRGKPPPSGGVEMDFMSQAVDRGLSLSEGIRVVTLPDADSVFHDVVVAAIAGLNGNAQPGRNAIMTALSGVVSAYPNLEIRQQDGLASFESSPRTWYVYRDGIGRTREP